MHLVVVCRKPPQASSYLAPEAAFRSAWAAWCYIGEQSAERPGCDWRMTGVSVPTTRHDDTPAPAWLDTSMNEAA